MPTSTQKQEEPTQDEPAKDEHGCVKATETWDAEQQKCVPKPAPPAEEPKEASILSASIAASLKKSNAMGSDNISALIKEVINKRIDDLNIDGKIDQCLKEKDIEIERSLRKGFGLDADPVIHMSDLIAYGRKQALEKADTGKRTPAAATGGPDGTVKPDPIQKLFNDARQGAA